MHLSLEEYNFTHSIYSCPVCGCPTFKGDYDHPEHLIDNAADKPKS